MRSARVVRALALLVPLALVVVAAGAGLGFGVRVGGRLRLVLLALLLLLLLALFLLHLLLPALRDHAREAGAVREDAHARDGVSLELPDLNGSLVDVITLDAV